YEAYSRATSHVYTACHRTNCPPLSPADTPATQTIESINQTFKDDMRRTPTAQRTGGRPPSAPSTSLSTAASQPAAADPQLNNHRSNGNRYTVKAALAHIRWWV